MTITQHLDFILWATDFMTGGEQGMGFRNLTQPSWLVEGKKTEDSWEALKIVQGREVTRT